MEKREMETRGIWICKISLDLTGIDEVALTAKLQWCYLFTYVGIPMFQMKHAALIFQFHNVDLKHETRNYYLNLHKTFSLIAQFPESSLLNTQKHWTGNATSFFLL